MPPPSPLLSEAATVASASTGRNRASSSAISNTAAAVEGQGRLCLCTCTCVSPSRTQHTEADHSRVAVAQFVCGSRSKRKGARVNVLVPRSEVLNEDRGMAMGQRAHQSYVPWGAHEFCGLRDGDPCSGWEAVGLRRKGPGDSFLRASVAPKTGTEHCCPVRTSL